ncbi:MAG: hypothetical protein NTZ35_12825 [Ignavibacteriales bacterium]|nr:hypothetical protein [Ignavibacteriales bacterium]
MINRITIVCMLLVAFAACSSDTKPTMDEVEPALKTYLLAEKARTCNGKVEVERLTVTGVGEFDKQWGGWPVYATFAVTCFDGGNRTTWESNDPSEKVMTSLVRKNAAGDYECFIPDMFRDAQEQMKKQLENMMKK